VRASQLQERRAYDLTDGAGDVKKAEDRNSFVVRVYNPTDEEQKGKLKFNATVSRAWLTNLNEKRQESLKVSKSNAVPVVAGPHKIVTVEISIK